MEKYRQFADETLGVNPFVPTWVNVRFSLPHKVGRWLLCGLLLVPVRMLVFLLGFLLLLSAWLLLALVGTLVPGIVGGRGTVVNALGRLLLPVCARICLLGLGFLSVSYGYETDPRRLRLRTAEESLNRGASSCRTTRNSCHHGSLVFANAQGPCDVLYFALFGYNSFVFAASAGTLEKPCGVIPAFFRAIRSGADREGANALRSAQELGGLRTVIFAEGGRTNGTCVLPFTAAQNFFDGTPSAPAALSADAASASSRASTRSTIRNKAGSASSTSVAPGRASLDFSRIGCVTVSYGKVSGFTPAVTTTDSMLSYVLRLQCQWFHSAQSIWLSPKLVGLNIGGATTTASTTSSEAGDGRQVAVGGGEAVRIRKWIATMPSPVLHEVANAGSDLGKFMQYWNDTAGKKKYT